MRPKEIDAQRAHELFRSELVNLIDQRHALARLAHVIDWQAAADRFGGLYAEGKGRPGVPIRLMVGLHYLKHAYNLSDEAVVARWVENPYWQYFCGEPYFRHTLPIDPSQMTRFRSRIGGAGCEFMLALTIRAGLATKAVAAASLAVVNVDTTVQEKAIAFPTDARLYFKARAALVCMAKRHGLALKQSFERLGKKALMMNGRYAHARQMQRARREQRRLHTQLGRVLRDAGRKIEALKQVSPVHGEAIAGKFARLLEIAKRIHAQKRKRVEGDPPKLYSVHAPEVACIAKGKAHKKYEFGNKVSVASTSKESFVVGMKSFTDNPNPFDGHTLKAALAQVHTLSGVLPKEVYVDRGYKGHGVEKGALESLQVWIAGAKRGVTAAINKKLKRRNAIEPVIGHLKSDGRLGRNFLKGVEGDAMNAILSGAGHNLRKILRQLALFIVLQLIAWLRAQRALLRVIERYRDGSNPLPSQTTT
jgi:IS5 family transposase